MTDMRLNWNEGNALHKILSGLPGRCPECVYHVATQGHRPSCQQSQPVNPEAEASCYDLDAEDNDHAPTCANRNPPIMYNWNWNDRHRNRPAS